MSEERERDDPELEELLRRLPAERPDPLSREEARRAFLAGEQGPRSQARGPRRMGPVMASGFSPDPRAAGSFGRGDEDDPFADWLAERAPLEGPAPEARRRARLVFLSSVAQDPPRLRARPRFRALVLVLAAAAILAVTFLLPKPARWQVEFEGPLRFAEREYQPSEGGRLAVALESSGTVETAGSRARFTLGDGLDVELLASSSLSLPVLPELDGLAPIDFELARGEAYVRTSSSYAGNPIRVRTIDADVSIHGTTIGVLVDALGTCVCVADGVARVEGGRVAGGAQEVGPRATLRVYRDTAQAPAFERFPEQPGPGTAHTDDLDSFFHGP